jgi:hypothetical protein
MFKYGHWGQILFGPNPTCSDSHKPPLLEMTEMYLRKIWIATLNFNSKHKVLLYKKK